MNCLECEELLQKRLDGEPIAAGAALDQHLSQCASCREQHAAAAFLLEGLKEVPRPRPAAGLAQSVASAVVSDRRQRRNKLRRRVFLTVALAASVMLLSLLGYYWLPPAPPGPKPDNLVHKDPPRDNPPVKPTPPVAHAKKVDPPSPLTPLMDRWADTTRDHAQVVLVAANLDAMENLPAVENLGPIDPGVREASQEVTDGVRTVTRNARRAFDFFARELPMPDIGDPRN